MVLRNKLNIAKNLTEYQKYKNFSNPLKDSGVYVYQLHKWINRSET